jgi:fibronectin type 3 domain-containing protein
VQAVNTGGVTALSPAASKMLTLAAPTVPTLTAGNGKLTVSWTAVDMAASYNVYHSATTTPPGTPTQIDITGTSAVITGLTNETPYYIWVQAADAGGVSALSLAASKTLTLAAPVAPTLTAGSGRLTVSWTAVDTADSYNVYHSTTITPPETPTHIDITGTSAVITGLINETPYYIWVQAVDAGGVSALSLMASKTLTLAAPAVPTLRPNSGKLTVSWTAVDTADSYKVYHSTSSTPPGTPTQENIARTSAVISGLTNATIYYVWVQAVNVGGVSALSQMATGTPTITIGDTGPGGGTIFFVGGGTYMECSGELGRTDWSTAVSVAASFSGGGFTNWHLPTKSELDLMFLNLYLRGLGGLSNSSYWSSTPYSNDIYAWYQNFANGYQSYNGKTHTYYVRAVRSF